ncbi:MAG: hypothetical protein KBA53_00680 [Thermoclostridium sp.]|nr:hypothetical protein [Thermoclostridium sp.]
MSKGKFILLNSVIMILVTAAVVSVAIEFVWMLVDMREYIHIRGLISNFHIGLIIGTAVVLINLLSMAFKRKPFFGYLLSFFGIATLLAGVYLHTGWAFGIWTLDLKWLIIFIISEAFTLPVVYFWRRQVQLYNTMLEHKKATIKDEI